MALDVAMGNPILVQVVQSLQNCVSVMLDKILVMQFAAGALEEVSEATTVHVLKEDAAEDR